MKSLRESLLRSVNEQLEPENKEEKDFIVKLLKSGKVQKNVNFVNNDAHGKTTQPADPALVDDFVKWALKDYVKDVEDYVIEQDNEDSYYKVFCNELEDRDAMGVDSYWDHIENDYKGQINFTQTKFIDDKFEYILELLNSISKYIESECKKEFKF